jgi:ABC-type multidrug transport system fused ATPase/permease subunit
MDQAARTGAPGERLRDSVEPAIGTARLPRNIFRFVLGTSGVHQLLLVILTVTVFLIEIVPLELQRRVVNDLVKHREYRLVVMLCAAYAGVVLAHGGSSISEPLLQVGVLASVLAYMTHLDPWMALSALALFLPQLVFVPLMQRAIIRRTGSRVQVLRGLSVSIVTPEYNETQRGHADEARIDRVFDLDMGIFRFKFTMNFLMNLCNHLQIVAALLLGGWYVHTDQLEIGGVVAFISGVGRLNDPWGDLVNYFRDVSVTMVKYHLVADAVNNLAAGEAPAIAEP